MLKKMISRLVLLSVFWSAIGFHSAYADTSIADDVSGFADGVNSIFDKAAKAVAGKLSLNKVDSKDVPRVIAVLPAFGKGDDETKETVSVAVHNNLSAKTYELLKPFLVERGLLELEQRTGSRDVQTLSPKLIAESLDVDGVVLVRIDEFEKVYAGAYAHFKIGISVILYSKEKSEPLWQNSEEVTERKGGLSLDPLSMIATAITSTQALTDSVRLKLIDELARTITGPIPVPSGDVIERPQIQSAFSNALDGPFKAGEEIQVAVTGEPGLLGTFDLLPLKRNLELREIEAGKYIGRYVVGANDGEQSLSAVLNLKHPRSRADLEWRVPGDLRVDTIVPGGIERLRVLPAGQGIRLTWDYPKQTGNELFSVARSDPATGVFTDLGEVAVTEFVDQQILPGEVYFYRVQPIDAAGNTGPIASERVVAIKPGPTDLTESPTEDLALHAIGSPYRINGRLTIPRGVTLKATPGVIIEFGEGAALDVLGNLQILGEANSPIVISGPAWRIRIKDTGKAVSRLEHIRLAGKLGGLSADNSSLEISHCRASEMDSAVSVTGNSQVLISHCEFRHNKVAIDAGLVDLSLRSVNFSGNDMGLMLSTGFTLNSEKLVFKDNRLHVKTAKPLNIDGSYFAETSYPGLLARVEGPVSFVWESNGLEESLYSKWLTSQLSNMLSYEAQKEWSTIGDQAVEYFESTRLDIMRDLARLAYTFSGKKAKAPIDEDIQGIASYYRQRSGSLIPWVQNVRLPLRKDYAESDFIFDQDARRRAFQDYSRDTGSKSFGFSDRGADFAAVIEKSMLLHKARNGFYVEGWIVHLLNKEKLAKSFNLGGPGGGETRIAVINPYGRFLNLREQLQGVGFKLIPFGSGPIDNGMLKRAREMNVDVLLMIEADFNSVPSRLSENLNITAVKMDVQILSPENGNQIDGLVGQHSEPSFSAEGDRAKLLTTAFEKSKADIVDALRYASRK